MLFRVRNATRIGFDGAGIRFVDPLRRTRALPLCLLIRCEFYALNGPKGSLVGRRAASDHGAVERP